MNLWAHLHMIRKFRKAVRRDSPNYYVWHIFCGVIEKKKSQQKKSNLILLFVFFLKLCLNAWIWSTVFHARDYPLTEFLDYGFAYLMVLATTICMIIR